MPLHKMFAPKVSEPLDLPAHGSWPETKHHFDKTSVIAVNAAIAAGRPLLLRGEPGIGKSQLARAVAKSLKVPFLPFVVDERTERDDLLYTFDAVARLAQAQVSALVAHENADSKDKPNWRTDLAERNYFRPEVLWWAFDWGGAKIQAERYAEHCRGIEEVQDDQEAEVDQKDQDWSPTPDDICGPIVLIDEIDKADPSVPNGLLECLGNTGFRTAQLGKSIKLAKGMMPPLVFITTNEDRDLPVAFLRRCLVLEMPFPRGRNAVPEEQDPVRFLIDQRARAIWKPEEISDAVCETVANRLLDEREHSQREGTAIPGAAEFLDILRILVKFKSGDEKGQLLALDTISDFALKKTRGSAMTKLAAINQADLLSLLLEPIGPGLNDTTADLLGYERTPTPSVSGRPGFLPTADSAVELAEFPELPAEEPENEFPTDRPKLKFLMPVRAETLKTELPIQDTGNPITDKDLRVPWEWPAPPHQPLIAWSRLAPFLKNRLGTQIRSVRLDERKLMRQVCSGRPLRTLPRRMRTGWAAKSVILWDETPEMFPFVEDMQWLFGCLMRERGTDGLKVITISNMQNFDEVLTVPASTPIVAISAMGQFTSNKTVQLAWQLLSRQLAFRQQTFHALTPCPRHRWTSRLARAWSSSAWDRGQRLPRQGGMAALPSDERFTDVTEAFLDLLAPASRIEPPLLREARLLLGPSDDWPSADIGTEWDAWHHSDCWHSDDCFGFHSGPTYDRRLHRLFDHFNSAEKNRELATKCSAAIRKHHKCFAKPIAAEAELRDCLLNTSDNNGTESPKSVLESVVDRLRQLAMRPNSAEDRRTGLPAWFMEMTERLSQDMRQHPSVDTLIARGLALAHTWQRADAVVVLPGVNSDAYSEETRRVAMRIRNEGSPMEYLIGLSGSNLSFFPADEEARPQVPLGRLSSARHSRLQVEVQGMYSSHHSLQPGGEFHLGISFDSIPDTIRVESSHGVRHFAAIEHPSWADRVWYDLFGIAAEFSVRGVAFVLRWIPPGQFLMGSPESEVGRYDDEGPQHEVTISSGFWLGETLVTQEQWAAVVEAGMEQQELWNTLVPEDDLDPKPCRFTGAVNLPVENVSPNNCDTFCRLLDGLMPDGPTFSLPSEAQWEYACRTGIQSSFNDGSTCTDPAGRDPALDQLGWYDKNSDGKTHPVKEKRPNAWGLYDMHGNVWEWCVDLWEPAAYNSRIAGVVDPVNESGESVDRVVRGGSWSNWARGCRAACRDGFGLGLGWGRTGLRLSAGQEPRSIER
ncbi:MAG: SUMF1/EgtB/PvdO family nonheme iron enzyme [Planctomycetaceae bacterium]